MITVRLSQMLFHELRARSVVQLRVGTITLSLQAS